MVYHLQHFLQICLPWRSWAAVAKCSLQHSICSLLRAWGHWERLWAPSPLQLSFLCIQSTETAVTWSHFGQQCWVIPRLCWQSLKILPAWLLWYLWDEQCCWSKELKNPESEANPLPTLYSWTPMKCGLVFFVFLNFLLPFLSWVSFRHKPLIHSPCKTAGSDLQFQAAVRALLFAASLLLRMENLSGMAKLAAFPAIPWHRKMGIYFSSVVPLCLLQASRRWRWGQVA